MSDKDFEVKWPSLDPCLIVCLSFSVIKSDIMILCFEDVKESLAKMVPGTCIWNLVLSDYVKYSFIKKRFGLKSEEKNKFMYTLNKQHK